MTQTQHTPGPWYISRSRIKNNILVCHGDADTFAPIVCEVYNDEARHTLNTAANATLIAAAPDLLAALSLIADRFETANAAGESLVIHYDGLTARALRAALQARAMTSPDCRLDSTRQTALED